ncbi:hypothetical protein ZWY2020_017006 [Hordeum vulgare]|nr:hypothetical protein ZWY2020_017006 [Hordeum vulgare]
MRDPGAALLRTSSQSAASAQRPLLRVPAPRPAARAPGPVGVFCWQRPATDARFLEHFPTFPNSFLIGGAADYFVIELTAPEAKLEPVLVHYLSRMTILQGWELRMSTSTRLKSCLHSFTSPGGRAYPRRVVRHEAWNTLDLLYLM